MNKLRTLRILKYVMILITVLLIGMAATFDVLNHPQKLIVGLASLWSMIIMFVVIMIWGHYYIKS